jgi:hypothetical protein
MLDVVVSQAPGGQAAPVSFNFAGASPEQFFAPGKAVPGATQPVYATVPAGAHQVTLTIGPLTGMRISHASVARYGQACAA